MGGFWGNYEQTKGGEDADVHRCIMHYSPHTTVVYWRGKCLQRYFNIKLVNERFNVDLFSAKKFEHISTMIIFEN